MEPCNKFKRRLCAKEKKTYLILREEKEEVREFIEEQLRKGYIRPLKLPQTLPVFFVEKRMKRKE